MIYTTPIFSDFGFWVWFLLTCFNGHIDIDTSQSVKLWPCSMDIGSPWHWAPYSWWAKIAVVAYPEICCQRTAVGQPDRSGVMGKHQGDTGTLLVKSKLVEMYGYVQPVSRNIEIHMLQMLFICYSFVKRLLHFSFIQNAFLDVKRICYLLA